jgi:hypothetical protein
MAKKKTAKAPLVDLAESGHVVELKPHTGIKKTRLYGNVTVRHNQDYVFVNGRHCGYVGTAPGAPVIFLEPPPEDIIAAVVAHVTVLRGEKPCKVAGAPSDSQVAESLPDEDDE